MPALVRLLLALLTLGGGWYALFVSPALSGAAAGWPVVTSGLSWSYVQRIPTRGARDPRRDDRANQACS